MKPVLCLACDEPMEVKPDSKGRPYLYCYPCGAQTFVKSARGVALFEKKYGKDWKAGAPAPSADASEPPAPQPTQPKKETKRESVLDKNIL